MGHWKGGYRNWAYFNEEAKSYEFQDFEYLEFEGNLDKLVENYNKSFYEEYTSCGMDYCEAFTLWYIIKEEIMIREV